MEREIKREPEKEVFKGSIQIGRERYIEREREQNTNVNGKD